MGSILEWPEKHPDNIEPFFIVWCDPDGTNDGGANDDGELKGQTIGAVVWTVPSGITKVSENTDAVTIDGVTYGANLVTTIWLSGGKAGIDYFFNCKVTLSDGITVLNRPANLPVRV